MFKVEEWNQSYQNKDNFLFYPHEEVIRFVSKYIKKRVGIDQFIDIHKQGNESKVLDVGCGIGRHVKYLRDYDIDAYGVDFSSYAIETAVALTNLSEKLKVASVEKLPFENNFFDFALSHGVFDSMPFETALKGMSEMHRCLKPGGLFYIDLISGDNSDHFPEFNQEEIVTNNHEKGTIQSFFNWSKIEILTQGKWQIKEAFKIKRDSVISNGFYSRYHMVLKKI